LSAAPDDEGRGVGS